MRRLFWYVGNIRYLDYDDDFKGTHVCQSLSNYMF